MATKIVTKNSSTASAVPTASDLVQGELAVNVADKRLFTEDNAGAIVELGTNPTSLTVSGEITATSLDISGDIDVDGTTNLDVVDIDGAVDMASTLAVGSGLTVTNGSSLFNRTHSTTTASLQILNLKATSSGDMANGFGPSIVFGAADTGTTSNQVAEINVVRAGSDTAFNLELQTADATRMTIGNGGVDVSGVLTANAGVTVGGNVDFGDLDIARFGVGNDLQIFHNGTDNYIKNATSDQDLIIQGNDGGNIINALTLDMSAAGAATFNAGATFNGTATMDGLVVETSTDPASITLRHTGNTSGLIIKDYSGGEAQLVNVDNGPMVFKTNDTERMRIAADGSISTQTLGTSNVRFGVNAGNSIASGGTQNVVVGDEAGTALTTGNSNVAVGYAALTADTLGDRNVAVGVGALIAQNFTSTTDVYNTAVGYRSGAAVTTGVSNTLIGGLAGDAITTGDENTAVGQGALGANTTASGNVAVGQSALLANTTGAGNVALGRSSLAANTTASANTGLGRNALLSNTTGANNVAVGHQALDSNTTASNNTAVGKSALGANTTGARNVSVGNNALDANTTGASNTGVGSYSLTNNTTASYNTAVGDAALGNTTTGASNTAMGYNSLLANTTGADNTGLGNQSLKSMTTGTGTTAIGKDSGVDITTGNNNTCLGAAAGNDLTTGTQNVFVGYNARPSAAGDNYSIVISTDQDLGKGTSTAFIAPNGGGVYQDNNSASWATVSDRRIKKNIEDCSTGLEAINQIRVRNFEYRTENEIVDFENPRAAVVNKEGTQLGVIAQEIEHILPDVVKQESTGVKSVNPDNLTWYLVNAVKQLSAQVDALTARIETLEG